MREGGRSLEGGRAAAVVTWGWVLLLKCIERTERIRGAGAAAGNTSCSLAVRLCEVVTVRATSVAVDFWRSSVGVRRPVLGADACDEGCGRFDDSALTESSMSRYFRVTGDRGRVKLRGREMVSDCANDSENRTHSATLSGKS